MCLGYNHEWMAVECIDFQRALKGSYSYWSTWIDSVAKSLISRALFKPTLQKLIMQSLHIKWGRLEPGVAGDIEWHARLKTG